MQPSWNRRKSFTANMLCISSGGKKLDFILHRILCKISYWVAEVLTCYDIKEEMWWMLWSFTTLLLMGRHAMKMHCHPGLTAIRIKSLRLWMKKECTSCSFYASNNNSWGAAVIAKNWLSGPMYFYNMCCNSIRSGCTQWAVSAITNCPRWLQIGSLVYIVCLQWKKG